MEHNSNIFLFILKVTDRSMSVGAIIVTMLLLVIIIHGVMCSLTISMSYMSLKIFWK